jgi:hypothetical protein
MSRRRPSALAPVIVVAAVLIGGGLLSALRDGDGDSDGNDPVERPAIVPEDVERGPAEPPELGSADELESYRLVYRVDAFGPAGVVVDTEVREVARPFAARSEFRAGEPPGGELTSLSVWDFGVTEVGAPDQQRATLLGEPLVPNGEAAVTADLDDAINAGVLVYRAEQQEIAGRTCHRYRTGGPIDVVQLTAPTDAAFADLCIDEAGLVLGESWIVDGQLFRRRTAVEVETGLELDHDRFEALGEPPRFGDGGGLIGQVTADSQFPDVDHWALPVPPDGFRLRGRYSFTPPAAGDTAATLGEQPPIVTGISDVYEASGETVIIVNGGTSNGSDALGDLSGEAVDLGDLGSGYLRRRVRGAELLIRLPEGRFVKVHGTLAADALIAIARDLIRLDGAGKTITALEHGEELPQPAPGDDGIPHEHEGEPEPHTHGGGEVPHSHD